MSEMMRSTRFCLLFGALSLAACAPEGTHDDDDEVSSQDLANTAIENVEQALRGTVSAGGFIADSTTVASSIGAFGGDEECDFPTCTPDGCPDPVCQVKPVTIADLQEGRAELDESIDDLVEYLRTEVFTRENLESQDEDSATFLLGPDYLCDVVADDDGSVDIPGGTPPAPQLDPECVDRAHRLQPRLRLSSPGEDDVDVELLLTAERRNLVTLELHRDRLAVIADLGQIQATLDAAGESSESLTSLDGKLSLALERNGANDYSLSANVLEDVVVVADDESGTTRVSLGASAPTAELRLDGNARRITATTDLGRFTLSGPLESFHDFLGSEETLDPLGDPVPPKTYTGDIEVVLPGLEAQASYDAGSDALNLSGLGAGDASTTLKWNGITIAQFDLNPNAGRRFDLGIQRPATGGPIATFSPTFDLSLLFNFAPLSDQIDDLASYLMNDTLRIFFDGANPSVQASDDQVRVVSGTLELTSSSVPDADVSVPAGMCLLEVDPPASSHELLGSFGAGTCVAE